MKLKRLAFAIPLAYIALVVLAGITPHDGPSLPPAPWEELR